MLTKTRLTKHLAPRLLRFGCALVLAACTPGSAPPEPALSRAPTLPDVQAPNPAPPRAPTASATIEPPTEPSACQPADTAQSACASPPQALAPSAPPPSLFGGIKAVESTKGIVVAVEPLAAGIGARVLAEGGNAADAAVATAFALAVTHPNAASLGGGGFALVRGASRTTLAIDFRETAPRSFTTTQFAGLLSKKGLGHAAVGVPGFVRGLALLRDQYGTLPLATLLAPAIALAQKGFPLGAFQARLLERAFADLKQNGPARRAFAVQGKVVAQGQRLRQPDLAWVLERIAQAGAEDFYSGEIAQRLVATLGRHGMAADDLRQYRAAVREPLSIPYGPYTLETMPPPSAGGVALIGTLLASAEQPLGAAESAHFIHQLLEAQRRAQAVRKLQVVDPDSLTADEQGRQRARFVDPSFWRSLPIDPEHATPSSALRTDAQPEVESEHTTHLSIADRNGMVVSLTTTLSGSYGARVVAGGTGIVLNNALGSFSWIGENQPRGGQRTTSSMAPTLLLADGEAVAVLGTPGGDTIPSTLAQIVQHLVDRRRPLDQAIEAPRWHQSFLPDEGRYEVNAKPGNEVLTALTRMGHKLRRLPYRMGDANCIVLANGSAFGYADSREPGTAMGASP